MKGQILNLSAYRFVTLPDAQDLQRKFQKFCLDIPLKGSLVFSSEGVNLGVAGTVETVKQFSDFLTQDSRFAGMVFKESWSEEIPYRRMLVKFKSMLVPSSEDIDPKVMTGKRLDPLKLKEWLDNDEAMVLIDTRNQYEFDCGAFEKSIHLNIEHFRDFAEALEQLPLDYRDKRVVMVCTGGIRCEKATPIAMKKGFNEVYQLEGGILDYFKHCQGAHWKGECFVFDERVSLNADLRPY